MKTKDPKQDNLTENKHGLHINICENIYFLNHFYENITSNVEMWNKNENVNFN